MKGESFKDYVLDQLRELEGLECRRMFGGHGFYCRGRFFAIIYHGRLYFKTSAPSRARYEERGMDQFRPRPSQGLTRYYEVPPDVIEDSRELTAWAREAVAAAA
jgi:DNA transformation protein